MYQMGKGFCVVWYNVGVFGDNWVIGCQVWCKDVNQLVIGEVLWFYCQ